MHVHIPLIDEILVANAHALGDDATAYRNHVYRGLNYFAALTESGAELPESVLVAAAFHDIGFWTERTFDYLEPSARAAQAYLVGTVSCLFAAEPVSRRRIHPGQLLRGGQYLRR